MASLRRKVEEIKQTRNRQLQQMEPNSLLVHSDRKKIESLVGQDFNSAKRIEYRKEQVLESNSSSNKNSMQDLER